MTIVAMMIMMVTCVVILMSSVVGVTFTSAEARLTHTNGLAMEDAEKTDVLCDDDGSFKCDVTMTQCILPGLTCNGQAECRNGMDESVQICGCLAHEYQCNMSHCVDAIKRCDHHPDCVDGSDEDNCETYQCPSTHVKCENHFCVPRDQTCDFVDDCGDNSDEKNCEPRQCYPTEFQCDNNECVAMTYLCDGQADCKDGSDELAANCDRHFLCPIGFYVLDSLVCDGWEDCIFTHQDELHCRPCTDAEFRCHSSRCISQKNVCDGFCDCLNSCEDEINCGADSYGCRRDRRYRCRGIDRCIDMHMVCDGHNDCKNTMVGMDEFFCFRDNKTSCADFPVPVVGENPVLCPRSGQCVPESVRCDHNADCVYGEDEENCTFPPCAEGQFRCVNEECVPESARCDGKPHCSDRTDEDGCEAPCEDGYKSCVSGGQCVTVAQWCDHKRDCPDGSDEAECEYRPCREGEFRCHSGQCVHTSVVCYNGKGAHGRGCYDNSHLINCSDHACQADQFKCRRSYCVDVDQKCDGNMDCEMTYWDEHGCPNACPYWGDRVCVCQQEEMNCEHKNLSHIPFFDLTLEPFSKFHMAGNRLMLTSDGFAQFTRMTILDISNNSITEIPDGCFLNQWRLVSLNLENNLITELRNGSFQGLSNLKTLYLAGNPIHTIYPEAFIGLTSLTFLDLSNHQLITVNRNIFVGLRNLHLLNLSHNAIITVENGAFNGLDALLDLDVSSNQISVVQRNVFHGMKNLNRLYTDSFRFCCLAGDVPECYPKPDEFSSCKDLMSNYVLRVSIWILGMVASFGNLLVIGWRARDIRGGKVHSFLITNLAIGDFFMGVYLLIIAVVDSYYRGVYILFDQSWRQSDLCRFSGFISTFSSELSVFTLTVITMDRLICIIFPLKLKRLGLKQASLVMALVWIGVFWLSALPLLGWDYFRHFYGRSGVCLALHVTPTRPPGWEYSVAIFLVVNFASFLIIFFSYLWMFIIARKTRSAVRSNESKSDTAMARRMTLIVMTDFMCWVPIILLGFASLAGARSSNDVYAWLAVFVLPLNSAINPVLYTISTAPFLGNVRKRASRFRKSFITSFTNDNTKHSYIDDRTTNSYCGDRGDRKSNYRHMDLIRMRSLNKSPIPSQSESDI